MNSWVAFLRLSEDGRLTAIYGWNLFWAVSRYWIEILTSNFVCLVPQNKKSMTFCQGRLIQDGRLTAIYGWNLFLAITKYWIEILTSNFVCWHLKIKPFIFCHGRQTQDSRLTAIYSQNLFRAITRYWSEILTSNFVCWYLKKKSLWHFVEVVRFKMANWQPYMLKTYYWP